MIPVEADSASEFGLLKTDDAGRIVEFSEKPKGDALEAMRVDTTALGLTAAEASARPYLASMGIYVFKYDRLEQLLTDHFRLAVRVQQFEGQWLYLGEDDRTERADDSGRLDRQASTPRALKRCRGSALHRAVGRNGRPSFL